MLVKSKENEAHLRAALDLASRALGTSAPNPAVGCVITDKDGYVVGRGYTQPGGRPHAEVMALAMAGENARGGVAYVSLEPCCHQGKSGPCSLALIDAGIRKVVIAARDSDPRVNGGGIAALRAAGLAVEEWPMQEAEEIIAGFAHRIKTHMPLFIAKMATSMDAKIALSNGSSKWITSEDSRHWGHRWRMQCDAIMTSIGTVEADDPELTCRLPGCRSPIRIVIDKDLRLSTQSRLVQTLDKAPLWLVISEKVTKIKELEFWDKVDSTGKSGRLEILRCPLDDKGKLDLRAMAGLLGEKGLNLILIEAGGKFGTAMLRENLVQRLLWFQADLLIGGDGKGAIDHLHLNALEEAIRLKPLEEGKIGSDRWFYYKVVK